MDLPFQGSRCGGAYCYTRDGRARCSVWSYSMFFKAFGKTQKKLQTPTTQVAMRKRDRVRMKWNQLNRIDKMDEVNGNE